MASRLGNNARKRKEKKKGNEGATEMGNSC
jgi:hypothetical protein